MLPHPVVARSGALDAESPFRDVYEVVLRELPYGVLDGPGTGPHGLCQVVQVCSSLNVDSV